MDERRQGQHRACHVLSQVFADLTLAEKEIAGLAECDRKHRALCFIRESSAVIKHTIDNDLGPKLIE